MLFFRYLFDISSLRMNPWSPRFVYLFVVLRILVRAVSFHYAKIVIICEIRKVLHARGRENTNFFENYFIMH